MITDWYAKLIYYLVFGYHSGCNKFNNQAFLEDLTKTQVLVRFLIRSNRFVSLKYSSALGPIWYITSPICPTLFKAAPHSNNSAFGSGNYYKLLRKRRMTLSNKGNESCS